MSDANEKKRPLSEEETAKILGSEIIYPDDMTPRDRALYGMGMAFGLVDDKEQREMADKHKKQRRSAPKA